MISEFPLFCFTTLAGLAAGAYAVGAVFPVGGDAKRKWLFPLMCLVLLAVGLIGLPLHLGRPERMLIALSNPMAGIAQEAYLSMAFGIVLLIDVIVSKVKGTSPRALSIVGAVLALVLMFVMGLAYFVSLGVVAWASWTTLPLFVFGDLAMGIALVAAFDRFMLGKGECDLGQALVKKRQFLNVEMVLIGLAALAFIAEAVQFGGVGQGVIPFAVAAIVAVAGIGVVFATMKGKMSDNAGAWATFACLFVAVVVARYAFYAACVL